MVLRKLKYVFLLAIMVIFVRIAQAQDPVYSQYYASPTLLNPAYAGNAYNGRATIQSRYQWPSLQSQYQTYLLSYDQHISSINSGVGGYILADDAGQGIIQNFKIAGTYSYQVSINREWKANLGVEAGYTHSSLDWNKLIFGDQLNPVTGEATSNTSETAPEQLNTGNLDLGMGVVFYNKRMFGGISVKHLNTPNQNVLNLNSETQEGLPMRINFNAGVEIPLRANSYWLRNAFISPNILAVKQSDFYQFNVGAYLGLNSIYGGLWYRHTWNNADAAIIMIGLDQDIWKLGYSYDVTVSSIAVSTGGSHELSFRYKLSQSRPSKVEDCFGLFR